MSLQGSCLSYSIRPDQRGTLATISDVDTIIAQSIAAILETRQGERVMLPDYGIPDFVFGVIDAGFAARLAYHVERQILKYEPLVQSVSVSTKSVANEQSAALQITYVARGSNTPRNLIYPLWELRKTL